MWRTPIAECGYFSTEKFDIFRSLTVGSPDSFTHLLFLDGEADIVYGGETVIHAKKGSSVFVPAGADTCDIKGKCSVIITKESRGGNQK
jgi:mannose-6-phosphate isomerase